MELAATFYISVYGLAALSGGILAWAEEIPSVNMLAPPLAIAALFLNERHRWIRLSTIGSGTAGLVALTVPMYELYIGSEESRLLAGGHLLSLLQIILLFHDKIAPQYWWIFATSCLQIALAAVLTSSPMFGLLILLYMFWALWTLSVFTLLLARLRYGRGTPSPANTDWQWPELGDTPAVSPAPAAHSDQLPYSSFRNSFQYDPQETDINLRFVLGIGGLSAAALMLGLIFFLLTPRLWIGTSNVFNDAAVDGLGRNFSGFSEKVQLGDFGRILESSAPVLELRLTDETSGKPVPIQSYLDQVGLDEPYFRGTVLGSYQNGEWLSLQGPPATSFNINRPFGVGRRSYIRQTIRLEAIGSRTLFSMSDPHYGFVEDQAGMIKVVQNNRMLQFASNSGPFRGAIRYHLMVPVRQGHTRFPQYEIRQPGRNTNNPAIIDLRHGIADLQLAKNINPAYLVCPSNLNLVGRLAADIRQRTIEKSGDTEPSPADLASAIVYHLQDSGEFTYSLDQSQRDKDLDPIEDFLVNRKAGHCQYFATALALLLRASDIPSRVITGFKGGIDMNYVGSLQVQQRHAHAWVEAYLDGEWVTLDATPASREESVEAIGSRARWYHKLFTSLSTLWSDYVINLSFSKQQRDLYAPFQAIGQLVTEQFQGKTTFWQRLQRTIRSLWEHPEQWFSLRGGVTAAILMLLMVGFFYIARATWRLIWRLLFGPPAGLQGGVRIEFYERFLKLMHHLGLHPQPSQTQQEFAEQVEAEWLRRNLPPESATLARQICEAFYRLRFGNATISPQEEQDIARGLHQLELHVNHSRTFHNGRTAQQRG